MKTAFRMPVQRSINAIALGAAYFAAQRFPIVVPHHVEPWRIDDLIRFDPRWTIVYLSGCLLPFLLSNRRGVFIIAAVSLVFFIVLPIEGPRPNEMTDDALYRMLITIDRSLNVFPSLHAALAFYSLLAARRYRIVTGAWVALLLYSELATKQDFAVGIAAGILLAAAVWGMEQLRAR